MALLLMKSVFIKFYPKTPCLANFDYDVSIMRVPSVIVANAPSIKRKHIRVWIKKTITRYWE